MNALTILKRCRETRTDIQRLQQRIEHWRDVLGSISAPLADPSGGSHGSGDKDKIGRIEAEIDALERQIAERREAGEAEKVAACALVEMVPDLEGKVLFDYYVRRWDTPKIAQKEKYTAGYVRKTKRSAEQLMEMIGAERVRETLPGWYNKEKGED